MNTDNELKRQLEHFKKEITKAYKKGKLEDYLSKIDIYNYDFTINLNINRKLEYKSILEVAEVVRNLMRSDRKKKLSTGEKKK